MLWEWDLIGYSKCRNMQLISPQQPPWSSNAWNWVGNQGGGETPNGIMESYHLLTGEDLYDTAKANGLK